MRYIKYIALVIMILLIYRVNALRINNLDITPRPAYTLDDLTCSWNISGATDWNASWYNGSQLFITYHFNLSNPSYNVSLSHIYTKKYDTWRCILDISNTTASTSISQETNITINNSRPNSLTLYYFNESLNQWISIDKDITIKEDQQAVFDVNGTDPDNDVLTYAYTHVSPSTPLNDSSFDSSTGSFTWTPTHEEVTTHQFLFTAIDPEGIGLSNAYNITVQEVNDKPYFVNLNNQVVIEGNCSWSYVVEARDEETPNGPFNITIFNVSPPFNSNLSIAMISDYQARISFDPCPNFFDKGSHKVTLLVQELNDTGLGLENNTGSFNLTVIPVNHEPVIYDNGNATGKQGENFFYEFNATDLDNDTLSLSIQPIDCTAPISNPWINYLNYTVTYNYNNTGQSFAHATINISAINFTNKFVVCSGRVLLIASDGKENTTKEVYFNITNINDPPFINEISNYNNYLSQKNMSNLTAYVDAFFYYKINASDPDLLLIPRYNEFLNYSTNDSRFRIINGWLNFTPNQSMIGDYSINITVRDLNNSEYSRIMHLFIKNNTKPRINNISLYIDGILNASYNSSITTLQGFEDRHIVIDINSTDKEDCSTPDCGNINYSLSYQKLSPYMLNESINFSINHTTGVISFTPTQEQVGLYNLSIIIKDSMNAETIKNLLLYINYTNDKPNIDSVVLPSKIIESYPAIIKINTSDQDLLIPKELIQNHNFSAFNESLSLYTNITWDYVLTKFSNNYWEISFTPNSSMIGNHSILIWVNDSRNNTCVNCTGINNKTINIEILSKTLPPRIENVSVYNINNHSFIINWTNTWNPDITTMNMSIRENTSILINTTGWNDEYSYYKLNFTWIMDNNILTTTGKNYRQFFFDFFSQGIHKLTVIVEDTRLNKDNVSFIINVTNVNRPPILINPLINLTGNNSVDPYYEDPLYFTGLWNSSNISQTAYFYDPDLEPLNITIKSTNCEGIADIEINGSKIKVYGRSFGSCWAVFQAMDPYGASITSNNVSINVTDILPEENVQTPTSGGGSSTTIPRPVPLPEEVNTPDPINIIAPALVTIYSNKSIEIPIIINNTWTSDIKGVTLEADANMSNISLTFTKDKFKVIPYRGHEKVKLIVTNYRLGDNFEVRVRAKVNDPQFTDTALIMINSLEAASNGEDIKTKVTFARDFLGQNPECVELNELLDEADKLIKEGKNDQAMKLVQGAIEGCKYLISKSKEKQETPRSMKQYARDIIKNPNVWLTILLIFTMLTIILIEAYRAVKVKED